MQKLRLQAELTTVREQLLKAQEHANDFSRKLENIKESKDNHSDCEIKLNEAVASHSKELEAANAKVAEAEQQLEELTRSNSIQLELAKKTSSVRTICSLAVVFMPSKLLRAILLNNIRKAQLLIMNGNAYSELPDRLRLVC